MKESNLCKYKCECIMPYDQTKCLNNYLLCDMYKAFEELNEYIGGGAIDTATVKRLEDKLQDGQK